MGTRHGTPIYVCDVAELTIGKELRTGAASENAEEVVGTTLMLIGENSRRVGAAVDAKLDAIGETLPPDIQVKTVLNRSKLVDATRNFYVIITTLILPLDQTRRDPELPSVSTKVLMSIVTTPGASSL